MQAHCELVSEYGAPRNSTTPCSFSQRQGYITIESETDIPLLDLSPEDSAPGNYTDQDGSRVYRRRGLGKDGLIFQSGKQFLYVYWSMPALGCDATALTKGDGCTLTWGSLRFTVKASATGSINTLALQVNGLANGPASFSDIIDGTANKTEMADLDGNGWPEIYTSISSAGSGSYGSLVAYAVNAGKSLSPIYLPELSNKEAEAQGYMGHDEFALVGNRLVRRYPVYNQGDTNSAPSGGIRQLEYQLHAGEAGWQLVLDRSAQH
ncbi:hypothetical protein [Candidatus Litorirhabdus singularis]|uniref:hypothetical protein n=1 Tax=Candidatus Litorirhabdus singularis TaxID=2518993 RepID=UPI00242D6673|nr:hypothetical protein [Candidatus Litorirhabdus singularis]